MKTQTATESNVFGRSPVQPASEGTMPFRIVLRFLGAGTGCPYVVHLETLTPDGTHDGYHSGDYCKNILEGFDALKVRCAKYNLPVLDANGKRIPAKNL